MKNKKLLKGASLLIVLFAFARCTHDKQLMYKEDPRIYFLQGKAIDYNFSTKQDNFIIDTLYIPLRIMGSASKSDRKFSILVGNRSTAQLGYHLDFGSQIVAADSFTRNLPVYIYRRDGLKDSILNAYLTIGETSDFKPGYSDNFSTVDSVSNLHYKITINDQLMKPKKWDTYWANYFGEYSRIKHLFLIQKTGRTDWISSPFPQDINFLVQTAKFALYQYELANGPLLDENGQKIQFP